jgi:hypothetical protein
MRYATLLAKAALALVLPFILAHCASLLSGRVVVQFEKSAAILDARLERQKTWNCNQGKWQ